MFFWTLSVIGSWLLDILAIVRLTDSEKDLELLILRHQISILERQVKRPRISRLEKLSLAVIANKLKQRAGRHASTADSIHPDLQTRNRTRLASGTGETQVDLQAVSVNQVDLGLIQISRR
jgi:hypothetical protein